MIVSQVNGTSCCHFHVIVKTPCMQEKIDPWSLLKCMSSGRRESPPFTMERPILMHSELIPDAVSLNSAVGPPIVQILLLLLLIMSTAAVLLKQFYEKILMLNKIKPTTREQE